MINMLYCGDNLNLLSEHIACESVGLVQICKDKQPNIPWVDASTQKKTKRETGQQGKLILRSD